MLILEKKTSMAYKKSGLSPLRCRSVFAHTHTNQSCLLFCVRLVLLPLSYKLVHQCKHQPCATNGDKIDCQKSKCPKMQKKDLFAKYTLTGLLGELDVIECFLEPGKAPIQGEVTTKQEQVYRDLKSNRFWRKHSYVIQESGLDFIEFYQQP